MIEMSNSVYNAIYLGWKKTNSEDLYLIYLEIISKTFTFIFIYSSSTL